MMLRNYVSNVALTNYYPEDVTITSIDNIIKNKTSCLNYTISLYTCLIKYDGLLVLNPSLVWVIRSMILKCLSFGKIKIVFFDLLLPRPQSIIGNLCANIHKIALKNIDKFIFLHKDTSGYSKYYGINKDKCIYVPFKANNIEKIQDYHITDNGYLLSCGASYRDYVLLANALKHYPCQTIVVLPNDHLAGYHCSVIDETLFSDNVKIIRHDFNADSWCKLLSKCRAVVLPIRSDAIQCAGISVYLESMAFGKPVIITEGPATRGLLTENMAAICPSGDPLALSQAIKKVMEDISYRMKLSKNGCEYVKSLGGEERLVKDILKVLVTV